MTTLPTFKKSVDLAELLSGIEPEDMLVDLGCDYRLQTGSRGQQLNVKECPRCTGSDWKVYLNAESGLGNCFHGSCVGEPGFNLFTFAKHFLQETNVGTVDYLKNYSESIGWKPKVKKKVEPRATPSFVMPKHILLPHDGRNLKYITDRGFTNETTLLYEWGYCERAEFVTNPGRAEEIRQDYSARIMIPIRGLNGALVTFQGRDVLGNKKSKYLFPPGLPSSGRFLYGGHLVRGRRELFINEGAFDVAATTQALGMAAIGTFGKTLSEGSIAGEDQLGALLILKREGLKRINMMWDGEVKTILNSIKAALLLKSVGFEVNLVILPHEKDPNEVTKQEIEHAANNAIKVTSKSMSKLKLAILSGRSVPQMNGLAT